MSGRYKQGNFWEDRSCLEKILICAAIATILVVIILVILLSIYLTKDPPVPSPSNILAPNDTCNHQTCLNQSTQILGRIDPTVNPCDDFYSFSCGSLLKRANGNKELGSFFVILSESQRQILEVYNQPPSESEHKTVRIAKRFYRDCMDEAKIKRETMKSVRELLKKVGGWPVVEGAQWNEWTFWWIVTSYELRWLGHFYTSFLEISVVDDPVNTDRSIYKISIPDVKDPSDHSSARKKLDLMIEAAVAFGADKERADVEMIEMYDFLLNLQEQSYLRRADNSYQRITVGEFQNQYEFINWLEFINNVVGPTVRIFRDDAVLFPSATSLYKWFEYISTISRRTQANYIIWKVVEELIPYLDVERNVKDESQESRSEFCINQIRKKFSPSPLDIMYVRKYLPIEKRDKLAELLENLKSELIHLLKEAKWSNYKQKEIAIERISGLNQIIGAPGNYFDDEIFEDLDFQLEEDVGNNTTLTDLLSLINKNYESWKYYQIYSSNHDRQLAQWKLQTTSAIGDYYQNKNLLSIPATILQDAIFNEKRPNYLNYGSMGTLMGHHFFQILGESVKITNQDSYTIDGWEVSFKNIFSNTSDCLTRQFNDSNQINIHSIDLLLRQSLGLEIAYGAYNTWLANTRKQELRLQDVDYNERQLFWISAASYFCQPSRGQEENIFNFIVYGAMCNNAEFSSDFQCSLGSKMNPIDKCEIFSNL